MGRMGVAVVGLGRISAAHLTELQNLKDRVNLVAGVDQRVEIGTQMARRFGAQRFYANYEEALADPEVEAVILCTPHHTHVPLAIKAAEKGKHILVEKPLANSVEEADRAISAAERNGVQLMVAYNQRFLGAVMEAKRRFDSIGEPSHLVQLRAGFFERDNRPDWWKDPQSAGGLALPLYGSHVIDTFLWWLGKKPERVYAEAAHHNPEWGGEDEVSISMWFEGGVLAGAHLSFNSKKNISERFAIGMKGSLRISDNSKLWINGEEVLSETVVPYSQGGLSFRRQLEEFVSAIEQGREPLASGRETRATIEVLEAARTSMIEHRPVTLS